MQDGIELGYADIQALSDADAVAAFFERLGYNTSVRLSRRGELIATQWLGVVNKDRCRYCQTVQT